MVMLGVRLEPDIERRLERLAKKTGRTKSYYAKEAIRQYIDDREDSLLADEILSRNEPTFTLEEVRQELGLDS
jgi:RHH-type rel operon transcriptional repressor/antitoxin RelB